MPGAEPSSALKWQSRATRRLGIQLSSNGLFKQVVAITRIAISICPKIRDGFLVLVALLASPSSFAVWRQRRNR